MEKCYFVSQWQVICSLNSWIGHKKFSPNNISHQEEESILGGGAEVLPIYCYLLGRKK